MADTTYSRDSVLRAAYNAVHHTGYQKTKLDDGSYNPSASAFKVKTALYEAADNGYEVKIHSENHEEFEKVESELALLCDNARANEPMSEFDGKVAAILTNDQINVNEVALVAAAVGTALRRVRREEAVAANPLLALPSNHFGTLKKRESFELVVDRVKDLTTQFGCSVMIAGRQAGTNNKFVWFACGGCDFLTRVKGTETVVKVTATVKNHEDGKFGKQTIINRVAPYVDPAVEKAAKKAAKAAAKAAKAAEPAPEFKVA